MSDSSPGIASRLAGQSGLVMAGNAFTLLVGFPFQIYLARVLGAEQLGAFSLFEVIAQTAGALAGMGLSHTIVRFIPEHVGLGQHGRVRKLLFSVFSMTLLAGLVAAAVVTIGGQGLVVWMPELQAYAHLFPLVGAMTLLGMLTGLSAQALRAFLDIRYMILVASFLQLTLKIGIAVVLLWLGWELLGYLIAVVASLGLALAGMLWGLHRHLRGIGHAGESVLPETRRMWWSYSRIMYSGSLLGMAAGPFERFLIGVALDLASLGIWTAVRQLQSLPGVFLQVIITAVAPMLVGANAKNEPREVAHLYRISTDWVGRLGLPMLIFLAIFGDKVLGLYGPRFADAGQLPLLILVCGQFVNLATGPVGAMLNLLGHERPMLRINLISGGLFFVCLLALAPLFGLSGVAAAGALSAAFSNLAASFVMRQKLHIGWWSARYRRLVLPLIVCIAVALLIRRAGFVDGAWALVSALTATYTVFFLAYLSRGMSSEDKAIYHKVRVRLGIANEKPQ